MGLTLELWFHLPGMGGERPEHVAPGVPDEQQGGAPFGQARHHPGEALSVQLCGEQEPPGGAVAIWQLSHKTTMKEISASTIHSFIHSSHTHTHTHTPHIYYTFFNYIRFFHRENGYIKYAYTCSPSGPSPMKIYFSTNGKKCKSWLKVSEHTSQLAAYGAADRSECTVYTCPLPKAPTMGTILSPH